MIVFSLSTVCVDWNYQLYLYANDRKWYVLKGLPLCGNLSLWWLCCITSELTSPDPDQRIKLNQGCDAKHSLPPIIVVQGASRSPPKSSKYFVSRCLEPPPKALRTRGGLCVQTPFLPRKVWDYCHFAHPITTENRSKWSGWILSTLAETNMARKNRQKIGPSLMTKVIFQLLFVQGLC